MLRSLKTLNKIILILLPTNFIVNPFTSNGLCVGVIMLKESMINSADHVLSVKSQQDLVEVEDLKEDENLELFNDYNPDMMLLDFNYSVAMLRKLMDSNQINKKIDAIACFFLEMTETIVRIFDYAIDSEIDEFYEFFWQFDFYFSHLKTSPLGPPLKEQVIEEALRYADNALVLLKISGMEELVHVVYYYKAKLELKRDNYHEANQLLNEGLKLAKFHQDCGFYEDIYFELARFYSKEIIKAPYLSQEEKEEYRNKSKEMLKNYKPLEEDDVDDDIDDDS